MKNISRRVFIKGLAVAGVAAAASTVLAGCNTNMIPGIDDGAEDQPETPAASNSLTLTSKDNSAHTFSIKLSDIEVGSDAFNNGTNGSVLMTLTNNLGDKVYFAPTVAVALKATSGTANIAVGDYLVFVEAYANGLSNKTVDLFTDDDVTTKLADKETEKGEGTLRVYVKDVTDYKNITVKATLKKVLHYANDDADKHAYDEMDSKTITLNV